MSGRDLFSDDLSDLIKSGVEWDDIDAVLRLLEDKLNGKTLHRKQWEQIKNGGGLCEVKYKNPLLRLYYFIDPESGCCIIMSFVLKGNNVAQSREINRLKKFRKDYL